MKQTSLRSTTAILVVLSMVQPLPMLAQSASNLLAEGDGASPVLDGADALDIPMSSQQFCIDQGITDALECVLLIDERDAGEAAEEQAAEAAAEAQAEAQATVAAEEAEAEAEAEAAAEAQAEADAAAASDTAAEIEAEADVAAEAEADAAAEADAEADAAEEAEAEASAATDAAAEAAADEAEVRAREGAETARENEAAARAAIAAREEQEAADRAAEDDAAATEMDDDAAATQAAIDAAAQAEADAASDPADTADTTAMDDAATLTAQAAADAMAQETDAATLAGSDTETEAEEVTSEVLTEDTLRSSDEEFEELTDGAEPEAERQRGLSDLERAGLIGLGAVAVGAILLNNQRVQQRTGDRVILVDDAGTYTVLKDDDALLRVPGSEVRTERFTDGSTRTTVIRADGTRIITVRDVNGRALRRVRVEADGREYLLIDDTRTFQPVVLRDLPPPIRDTIDYQAATDRETLRQALLAADRRDLGRSFSLRQVREIVEVRQLAPEINLGGITFDTNSAAIPPTQAEDLREMGLLLAELVRDDPTELFLIEGHTDAVGDAGYNLLLSDRRAESVARAFSEYFGVAAENLIVQGYGERFLKIPTQSAERQNRRVSVRRITALVRQN